MYNSDCFKIHSHLIFWIAFETSSAAFCKGSLQNTEIYKILSLQGISDFLINEMVVTKKDTLSTFFSFQLITDKKRILIYKLSLVCGERNKRVSTQTKQYREINFLRYDWKGTHYILDYAS